VPCDLMLWTDSMTLERESRSGTLWRQPCPLRVKKSRLYLPEVASFFGIRPTSRDSHSSTTRLDVSTCMRYVGWLKGFSH
jgi:hypothetical protein